MTVGFTGSRALGPEFAGLVRSVVAAVVRAGRQVVVGDAAGADQFVRAAAPGAQVFRVSGVGRGAYAARSVAMVRAVAASSTPGFVGFPVGPCPSGVVPSPSSSACFSGQGSGTWATLAFAVGSGVPVVVFWCGSGAPQFPASWGSWVPAGTSGVWARGWRLVPAWSQPGLF